jgi:hypothetical protein
MTEANEVPTNPPGQDKKVVFAPHNIGLISMWVLATILLLTMLITGVRTTGQYRAERNIIQLLYVVALTWYLFQKGPSLTKLPALHPPLPPGLNIKKLIPVLIIALLFLAEFTGQVKDVVRPLTLPATIWIVIAWRREIRLTVIVPGLIITLIALFAGLPFYQHQYFGRGAFIIFLAFVTPMFVAGGLLSKRTTLGGSQLFGLNLKQAILSFLGGFVLFIPLGLANAASGSPGPRMTWVNNWWIPFSLPWFSGIVEETMWRLFLISLVYFLLRPLFNKQPAIAVTCAVLFSAILFGLVHSGSFLDRFLITGMLYGFPLAIIFAMRDWEHAVGGHYMINMIPTLMVLLGA